MGDEKYSIACTEVLEVLKYIPENDYNKIPKEIIDVLEKNKKKTGVVLYNPWKSLNEQNMSKTGRIMLACLVRNYWATESQKEKIKAIQNQYRAKLEKEKNEKYSYDNLFKNKRIATEEEVKEESTQLIEVKEKPWYKKIGEKIRSLFGKNLYFKK